MANDREGRGLDHLFLTSFICPSNPSDFESWLTDPSDFKSIFTTPADITEYKSLEDELKASSYNQNKDVSQRDHTYYTSYRGYGSGYAPPDAPIPKTKDIRLAKIQLEREKRMAFKVLNQVPKSPLSEETIASIFGFIYGATKTGFT